MPSNQKHRGQHPQDAQLFGEKKRADLQQSVVELSWLLSRGYADKSSVKLVGDRYRFKERQRKAILRASCSDQELIWRKEKGLSANQVSGKQLVIDGFNLLITLEAAISGGIILASRDGCYRDIASIHGTYKSVMETPLALDLIGKGMKALGIQSAHWYLDSPVSNSGRLKVKLYEFATANDFDWQVDLVFNPDTILAKSTEIVVSADAWIINECQQFFNLHRYLITSYVTDANVLDFAPDRIKL